MSAWTVAKGIALYTLGLPVAIALATVAVIGCVLAGAYVADKVDDLRRWMRKRGGK